MCHTLIHSPKFFSLLFRIDQELAKQTQDRGCPCGGVLHRADFPRKPRGCPVPARDDCSIRLSFCCSLCRKRFTAPSVRFQGRRVYLLVVMVLMPARRAGQASSAARFCASLPICDRTLQRWRVWWTETFIASPLWRADCARFMPPVTVGHLPASLLERFRGSPAVSLVRMLRFLATTKPPRA